MSALDCPDVSPDPLESDLVEAGRYATAGEAAEHGLVVLATGHSYWLEETEGQFRLLIEPQAMTTARAHLAAYDREARRWPPPPITDPWRPLPLDIFTPLIWAILILLVFNTSSRSPELLDRFALSPQLMFGNHEWWRAATALFLHADAAHVLANLLGGLLVFSALVSTFGRVRGWLLVFAAAISANLVMATLASPDSHRSVGASTAIFAGVGLLCGRAVRVAWRSHHPHRWRAMFGPFAAGATVLALYGAGGQRVDVGAHLAGFMAGLAFGFTGARAFAVASATAESSQR